MPRSEKPVESSQRADTMAEFQDLRQRLEADRDRLSGEIASVAARVPEFGADRDSNYGNHLADQGTDTYEEEKSLALKAHLSGMLAEIEEALRRFDNGTYGICEDCHQPIARERLEALPYATTCLSCRSKNRNRRVA